MTQSDINLLTKQLTLAMSQASLEPLPPAQTSQPQKQAQTKSSSHPILQSYKQVSTKLQHEHFKVKSNTSKITQLSQKLTCLQSLAKNSQRQSLNYQRKLQKLENTQKYATELLKMKYNSFVELEQSNSHRYNQCITQRAKLVRSRRISQSLYDQNKTAKLVRIREGKERVKEERDRSMQENQAKVKQQAQEVKEQEERLRDRKRKYESFKLQRAALNYNQKLEREYEVYKERTRYLSQLQAKAARAEEIFRKTQRLNKETSKIESIYLTDM